MSLYGAEAWDMRSAERNKVNVLEMKGFLARLLIFFSLCLLHFISYTSFCTCLLSFSALFHSCCSHAQVFRITLMLA